MSTLTGQEPLYSVYFAPRGYARMVQIGREIAQRHLMAFDKLIGVIGEAGSGKSLLIRGMFPGLELTNDDNGVNVRPLPLLDIDETGFYQAHTYHMDVRFESAFTQLPRLAEAVLYALGGKRVIIGIDLLYPLLNINAAHRHGMKSSYPHGVVWSRTTSPGRFSHPSSTVAWRIRRRI